MSRDGTGLFTPLDLREVQLRNRAWVSPMCMYSAEHGVPNEWHFVHLGSLARGGAGLVMAEATGIVPEGRITPGCTGIWNDEQVQAFRRITRFVREMGAVPGIQLAHAGRKASTALQWLGSGYVSPEEGGWETLGPSAIPFGELPPPREMTLADIDLVVGSFVAAAHRALQAGFQVVEIHAAHGYLLHEFMSPLSNSRSDHYGGSFENRARLTVETAQAVREAIGDGTPLFVRVSATDWVDGGWSVGDTVELAKLLTQVGVDLMDCSSGALLSDADIDIREGYQVPFAKAVREGGGLATAAVGLITRASHADEVIRTGSADAVFLGRAVLRNPHWPLEAAEELGCPAPWPVQYRGAAKRLRDRA